MSFFVYVCFPLFVAAFSFILSQSLLSPFYHSLQVISSLYSSFVLVLSFSLPCLFFLHPVPAYNSLNSLFHTTSFSVHFKLSLSFYCLYTSDQLQQSIYQVKNSLAHGPSYFGKSQTVCILCSQKTKQRAHTHLFVLFHGKNDLRQF